MRAPKTATAASGALLACTLLLAACASQTGAESPMAGDVAPGAVGAPAEVGVGAAMAEGVDPNISVTSDSSLPVERSVIRSASALLGVDDLTAAREQVARISDAHDGTILNEYVKSGTSTPPPPVYAGDMAMGVMPPGYGYDRYVDMVLTVPSAEYDETLDDLRRLGTVVSINLSAADVTAQVIDTDARIRAARSSVARIQALLDQAATLDEVIRLEQELTSRQGNLDSLVGQQASIATQVKQSTISLQMVPNDLLDSEPVPTGPPSLWERTQNALADAWTGLVIATAYLSPVLLLAAIAIGVVVVLRRRRKATER